MASSYLIATLTFNIFSFFSSKDNTTTSCSTETRNYNLSFPFFLLEDNNRKKIVAYDYLRGLEHADFSSHAFRPSLKTTCNMVRMVIHHNN